MKDKKPLYCEFCNYYRLMPKLCCCCLLSFKAIDKFNYGFWMIMSSPRLKTYFTRSFQHSVSILTNISAFVLQHLLKICMIQSPAKHEQTKITLQQIHSRLKKVHVSRLPVLSNNAIQDLITLALLLWINIRSLSTRANVLHSWC